MLASKPLAVKRTADTRKPRRNRPFAIDFHSHVNIAEAQALLAKLEPPRGVDTAVAEELISAKALETAKTTPARNDYRARLKAIDKLGFDMQAVNVNLGAAYYFADPAQALQVARAANDGLADFVSHAPDRFVGLCSVPLQDPALAARELERAVKRLGMKGAWILTNPGGFELGDEKFRPFWAKAQALDVPIGVHPDTFPGVPRLEKWGLRNTMGRPLEEGVSMASMIYEGVMEAFPKLKVSICHGGGYLPYYIGRHDFTFSRWDASKKKIRQRPSAYLKRFYYDTVVFDRDNLDMLLKKAGDTRIMLGSDFPWPVPDPVGFVWGSKLPRVSKERILWRNAARLLKLSI